MTATPAAANPMLHAALAAVAPSTTPAELDERLQHAGALLGAGVARQLLDELRDLGLVRVTRHESDERRFVLTSLGNRVLEAGFSGESAVPLAELERLRTDLLSTIAHELRTPLTAVRTGVGLLLEPSAHPNEQQRRQLLDSIERNAARMQRLIGDILELSRFRAGGVALQLRRFRAAALAEAAVAAVAPLAARRRQRIALSASLAANHAVYGDRRRLEQALLNLVANAQRFSADGGEVRVAVTAADEWTAWSVDDDGPGISDEDQARLFERFFVGRGDQPGPRQGVGLGLPTALAIAQAHGGTIEVRSVLGRGSSFTLLVPTNGPGDEQ